MDSLTQRSVSGCIYGYFEMRKRILSPSILAADCSILGQQICDIAQAGAEYVHIDVMDGVFVPSISFGIPVVETIRKVTDTFFDVHLMIVHPFNYIEQFVRAGANGITFHLESEDDPIQVINKIRGFGIKVGMSIKPGTPVDEIYPYLDKIDMVLVMTVEPGFGGQKYIPESTMRIAQVKRYIDDHGFDCDIEVDGGITMETGKTVLEVGANVIVAGSSIFKDNIKDRVCQYKKLMDDTPEGQVL